MTAPKHARDIKGKGRYYGDCGTEGCPLADLPDPGFMSVTNAQGVVAKPALVPAAAKATAAAAWDRLPQMVATSRQPAEGPCARKRVAERCGACRFCITSAIKAEHKNTWEKAADFGTLVHAHAHAVVLGGALPYDEEVAPFVEGHVRFLEAWRVDLDRHVEAAELTVISRKHGYAGTGDLWVHLPLAYDQATGRTSFTAWDRRKLWLLDGKSSMTKPVDVVYADQPLQLAALRYAEEAVLPDESVVSVPKFEGAAILNWRRDSHALIPQPAGRDVFKAFLGAVELQRLFHSQEVKAWERIDAPVVAEPKAVA
ncbi:hypothetical protein NPS01_25130 [Nocardioides psychrotolerans]|uniref:Uncharacterized protein n=1 Tax=Nocardioides psychrotolerans TaxID=1005945 RepID=A0A1I3LLT6_9ACTN|nr:hypothetical protein [Nocardioides psychrotolerans]GEP38850.1 hypothetical protein NPS01_25130 [Nocardioides psychrotolerans]SFI85455.1 hypothetical protein SAMN05216561_11416 [Nocardioides psychrotolerans]